MGFINDITITCRVGDKSCETITPKSRTDFTSGKLTCTVYTERGIMSAFTIVKYATFVYWDR